MTEVVEFHTGVADSLHFTCRLLRKAYRQGATVLVTAPRERLGPLDRALWTFAAQEFLPHERLGEPVPAPARVRRTPIWLSEGALPAPCPSVLVNVGAARLPAFDAFERVIEVVSTDADELREARARWRDYAARGLTVKHHVAEAAS